MKIDFKGKIKFLDGKELNETIGQNISNVICREDTKIDTIRAYTLGVNLYQGKSIDVEKTSLEEIKVAVEESKSLIPYAKAQCLIAINEKLKEFKED